MIYAKIGTVKYIVHICGGGGVRLRLDLIHQNVFYLPLQYPILTDACTTNYSILKLDGTGAYGPLLLAPLEGI